MPHWSIPMVGQCLCSCLGYAHDKLMFLLGLLLMFRLCSSCSSWAFAYVGLVIIFGFCSWWPCAYVGLGAHCLDYAHAELMLILGVWSLLMMSLCLCWTYCSIFGLSSWWSHAHLELLHMLSLYSCLDSSLDELVLMTSWCSCCACAYVGLSWLVLVVFVLDGLSFNRNVEDWWGGRIAKYLGEGLPGGCGKNRRDLRRQGANHPTWRTKHTEMKPL